MASTFFVFIAGTRLKPTLTSLTFLTGTWAWVRIVCTGAGSALPTTGAREDATQRHHHNETGRLLPLVAAPHLRDALLAVARAVLSNRRGTLAEQITRDPALTEIYFGA